MPGPSTSEFTELPDPLPVCPEPVIRARPLALEDCPGGAEAKMRKAAKLGFDVSATYALGYWAHADGMKFTLKHSILVRIKDRRTGQILAGAHWLRSLPKEVESDPAYGRAEWLRRVIAAYPRWGADWTMFRDRVGVFSMKELDVWLADRSTE